VDVASLAIFSELLGPVALETPRETMAEDFEWSLLVDGLVQRSLNLTLEKLGVLSRSTVNVEDVVLAYERDGKPLPEKLRLVVPGKWGYNWIGQVVRIELVNYNFKGFGRAEGTPTKPTSHPTSNTRYARSLLTPFESEAKISPSYNCQADRCA